MCRKQATPPAPVIGLDAISDTLNDPAGRKPRALSWLDPKNQKNCV
jgi:hypothetical protein